MSSRPSGWRPFRVGGSLAARNRALTAGLSNVATEKCRSRRVGRRKTTYHSVAVSHELANGLSGRGSCERVGSAWFVALISVRGRSGSRATCGEHELAILMPIVREHMRSKIKRVGSGMGVCSETGHGDAYQCRPQYGRCCVRAEMPVHGHQEGGRRLQGK
jgi:hypothetical protein